MILDAWLPVGYELPDGDHARRTISGGTNWQIIETKKNNFALISKDELHKRWFETGLLEPGAITEFSYGDNIYGYLISDKSHLLRPVTDAKPPNTVADALAFSLALKGTRKIDKESPMQDSIYVEKFNRLLPTYGITTKTSDDIILGYWLTGGAFVSATAFRRLRQMTGWRDPSSLKNIIETAGFEINEVIPTESTPLSKDAAHTKNNDTEHNKNEPRLFSLPGRPELEIFFNEHVIDIIQNHERYKALGIEFPSAIALHGPPGCGKTFAVEQLVEFLGWPSYEINSSSVASPYIHETSKKVAEVFDSAIENSPSVLVIDEMEAFLADREMGSGHHRVEEVAEFLRRIPEAV
ncbi:MAG: AAA family ATPase, partial [Gammaproteobacteria bacterium]|nr:AAA family ATPase [Gammaproteobacteria bacterium]